MGGARPAAWHHKIAPIGERATRCVCMQRVAKEAMSRSTAVDGRVISSTAAAAPLLTRRNTRLVRGTSWERTLNRTSSLRRRKGDDVDDDALDDALRFFLFCLCDIALQFGLLRKLLRSVCDGDG